jgi:starch synthase
MKILFVSSEVAPFSKTGGLGDVCAALPRALADAGHTVATVSPAYAGAADTGLDWEVCGRFWYWLWCTHHEVRYLACRVSENLTHILLYNPSFERPGVYGDMSGVYGDNQLRYALLSRASIDVARFVELDGEPWGDFDIIHGHDWQGSLAPVYLNALHKPLGLSPGTRTLLTVHNAAHQGLFDMDTLGMLDLSERHAQTVAFGGALNTLKAGLVAADAVTTVSPTYAQELQTGAGGFGLDPVFRARQAAGQMHGILNGIDTEAWDPSTDPRLPAHFTADELAGKAECKRSLQETLGLPTRAEVPLIGVVSRLDWQKGIDVLLAASPDILNGDVQFVALGTGDPALEQGLRGLTQAYPDKARAITRFDETVAARIYAAADIFIVPSLFEPCGLTQMYAMRYGAIPVVRATGGLKDSVVPWDPASPRGTGWTYERHTPYDLATAVGWAVHTYRAYPVAWAHVRQNGMTRDWSWAHAAGQYLSVYQSLHD